MLEHKKIEKESNEREQLGTGEEANSPRVHEGQTQQSSPDQQVPPKDLPGPDFLGRTVDKVKKAIEADNITDYERAYELYYQALELFLLALKWEKNSRSK
jgi:hypothetical protein